MPYKADGPPTHRGQAIGCPFLAHYEYLYSIASDGVGSIWKDMPNSYYQNH